MPATVNVAALRALRSNNVETSLKVKAAWFSVVTVGVVRKHYPLPYLPIPSIVSVQTVYYEFFNSSERVH